MSLGKKLLGDERPDPLGLISPERMEQLRAEAREKVQAKLRAAAEKKFVDAEMLRMEQEADPKPEYEMREIIIDAAEHTSVIRIDNQHFHYGQKYSVPKPVYDQLTDILARGWAHEREISVPSTRVRSNNRGVVLHGSSSQGGTGF